MPRKASRDDLDYLFVVTYGRSGSTLVAGLLNSLPGYLIRGENRDALHHLYEFHQTMLTESTRKPIKRLRMKTDPFFGIGDFPPQRSIDLIRRLAVETVLRPKHDTTVTGFKEIRWYQPDLEEYVAWLREVFPGAKFLVNTRDHASVLKSGWWARGDKAADLARIEDGILALAESLGDAAYRIHYDEYVANPDVLAGMFEWLGAPYDAAAVREVLAVRHSV